ncbi:Gfo/Idh/MocA family oxidoreductase [Parvularcula sp. ZS-1/3]|uniref:Gfo/Idh/MocA family oxidoreductase n=1 Tax=Parvularcula mediterranea TaxID=2732508 RepID=A0A7Y3RJ66_9PROT|nr:Gfo/Idh/MocA family oxidoreductase [Parvularcula mediterranea]NNU15059.1 Gfo/Idh/MocA family oxidoreductase [Parvularcula mediterranea]
MALRLGIVGTGKIANKHAVAISLTDKVELAAVASRKLETAQAFTAKHGGEAVKGWEALVARDDIEAVYIATPTGAKHEIAVEALAAGKHVIIEKPFRDALSAYQLERMAHRRGLVLWDATHFTHNPRTDAIIEAIERGDIGEPLSLMANFHADVGGRENIRFNPALEPYGALGDLGWYCARLVAEFAWGAFETSGRHAFGSWDQDTLVSISSVTRFMNKSFRLTMDCGFQAGAFTQEMTLIGTEGIISMDDFVHDWEKARIGEEKPQFPSGYKLRKGRSDPDTAEFIKTPSAKSHMIFLLENFADAVAGNPPDVLAGGRTMCKTQEFLDDIWRSLDDKPKVHQR